MKRIITMSVAILMITSVLAQAPEKMSYQAVVRDGSNALVTSTAVGMQLSILQGSSTGTAVYVETQTPTSNANGLVSLEIGNGTVVSGAFSTIDWSNGPYFIKTETDPTGGPNYTITGTSQLMSVPYALFSSNGVTNGTAAGEMLYWNGTSWVVVAAGTNNQVLTYVNGVPTWTGGTVTTPFVCGDDVTFTYNGSSVTYGTVSGAGNTCWLDRNLGASQVATSSTDAASYGDLYQWGRAADGHQLRTSATTLILSSTDNPGHGDFILAPTTPFDWRNPQNDNLWQGVNGVNNPCPCGYRLPTEAEWDAERLSWGSNNAAGAFASPLKLPVAGDRSPSNGSLGSSAGAAGYYWSSTVSSTFSHDLYFGSSTAFITTAGYRALGDAVRCLKD